MILFDKDDGAGDGGDVPSATPEDIKNDLDEMIGDLGGTTTPAVKPADEIDLNLDMEGDEALPVEPVTTADPVEPPAEPTQKAAEPVEPTEPPTEPTKPVEPAVKNEMDEIRNDFVEFAKVQLNRAGIDPDDALVPSGGSTQQTTPTAPVEPVQQTQQPPVATTPTAVEVKPVELTAESFDEIKDDPVKFAAFINENNKQIAAKVREEVLLEVTNTSQKFVQKYVNAINSVNQFYAKNPALEPYRAVVGFISSQLQQKHADWNRDKLIEESGKEAYRLLKLKPGTQPPNNGAPTQSKEGTKPPLFGKTGTRRGKPGEKIYRNKIDKELSEMTPRR
jgi:hypothetical protein